LRGVICGEVVIRSAYSRKRSVRIVVLCYCRCHCRCCASNPRRQTVAVPGMNAPGRSALALRWVVRGFLQSWVILQSDRDRLFKRQLGAERNRPSVGVDGLGVGSRRVGSRRDSRWVGSRRIVDGLLVDEVPNGQFSPGIIGVPGRTRYLAHRRAIPPRNPPR